MSRHPPSASRERVRERMARYAARKRAQAEAATPRVKGSVVFEPVTCPRCGDWFRGSRPLHSYAVHRGSYCPWFDDVERDAHRALVAARRNALAAFDHHSEPVAECECEIPPLHTGHELFERARAARRSWPAPLKYYSDPTYEDLLSEGVLALLEHRDPAEAMRRFMRCQPRPMLSLDLPAPWTNGHPLHEVLAA